MERLYGEREILLNEESFGPLLPYIKDTNITDVDFNGQDLWITDIHKVKQKIDADTVTQEFIEKFCNKVSMQVSQAFNTGNAIVEAESEELRITIVHEEAANTGRVLCIRKAPAKPRYQAKDLIRDEFCDADILSLLICCIQAKMNFVIGGEPNTGKTEFGKFLSGYIRPADRVITIEDTPEWQYAKLYPGRDCIALKVVRDKEDKTAANTMLMDYTTAIKTSLRLNPAWIMLSEARSKEAKSLLECWSTGVKGITTIHTDDVRKIPDRFMNMIQNSLDADRIKNDIFDFVNVGILLRLKELPDGRCRRYIDQLCFLDRENGKNSIHLLLNDGKWLDKELPESVRKSMGRAGIANPFRYSF